MVSVNPSDRLSPGNYALGTLVRERRAAEGLSLRQLSEDVGVTRQYLSRLERGQYAHPSSRVLTQIIKRLNISVEDAYAATGYTLPRDLPNFGPYLRAKHIDWPDHVLQELEAFYDFQKYKYSLE